MSRYIELVELLLFQSIECVGYLLIYLVAMATSCHITAQRVSHRQPLTDCEWYRMVIIRENTQVTFSTVEHKRTYYYGVFECYINHQSLIYACCCSSNQQSTVLSLLFKHSRTGHLFIEVLYCNKQVLTDNGVP